MGSKRNTRAENNEGIPVILFHVKTSIENDVDDFKLKLISAEEKKNQYEQGYYRAKMEYANQMIARIDLHKKISSKPLKPNATLDPKLLHSLLQINTHNIHVVQAQRQETWKQYRRAIDKTRRRRLYRKKKSLYRMLIQLEARQKLLKNLRSYTSREYSRIIDLI